MKISILIPCYNEELTIERSIFSCLNQTRKPDEIIIVNDSSTDMTLELLERFQSPIVKVVTTPKNTGNKSYAQEYGLQFITGDVFVSTDGDTILRNDFIETVEKEMADDSVAALAGYVESMKHNWLTACRAIDYAISQNVDKLAQDYMNFIFVIPGAAGVFRTKMFRKKIPFTHDTLTEDLDFTYRLHLMGEKIKYCRNAICYTQDPSTLGAYVNQMRRWFVGGWQNMNKHFWLSNKLSMIFELSLMYIEGLLFSVVALTMPFINLYTTLMILLVYFAMVFPLVVFAAIRTKRIDLLLYVPHYIFLKYVNAWLFLEQFLKEVIFKKKNLTWYKPERVRIKN